MALIGLSKVSEQRLNGQSSESVVQKLVAQIEEDIVLGYLHPRERLIEDVLIARFGAKRHTVREALARLERLGLIERQPNRGAIVRALTPVDVKDIYDVREILEMAAASQVIDRAGPKDVQRIITAQKLHDDAVKKCEPKTAFRANISFHQAFFAPCGNAELISAINLYGQKAHAVRSFSISRPELLARARDEHWMMIDALRSADKRKLLAICREHIRVARDAYIAAYRQRFPVTSAR